MRTRAATALAFAALFVAGVARAQEQEGTRLSPALEQLRETVSEMARNGCRKIIIVSGHGGNTNLVNFFAQTQLETPVDYVLYVISGGAPRDRTFRRRHGRQSLE